MSSLRLWGVWLAVAVALAWALPVQAAGGPLEPSVRYAELSEELVFRMPGPEGAAWLAVEFPWGGEKWKRELQSGSAGSPEIREVRAQWDGEMWVARLDVSEIPVLAELHYSWFGIPSEGAPWSTAPVMMDRPDPVSTVRYWEHVAGERVDVYGADVSRAALTRIADAGDAAVGTVHALLGETARTVPARPHIVVVSTAWDYMMLAPSDSSGVAIPAYGVTIQYLSHGVEALVASVIPHEIMHLYDPTAERGDVPPWFTEGLAMLAEDPAAQTATRALVRQAHGDGTLIPICWMGEYPRTDDERDLWYAQSLSMIEYVGEDEVRALQAEMADGTKFLQAWSTVVVTPPEGWGDMYLASLVHWLRRVLPYVPYALLTLAGVSVALLIYGEWYAWRERRDSENATVLLP